MAISPADPFDVDTEYLRHRDGVLELLRHKYPQLRDHEDAYQEAWFDTVKFRERGGTIDNLPGLLRDRAMQRACDLATKKGARELPVADDARVFAVRRDPRPGPDELVEWSVDAGVVQRVVEELGAREAAIIKLKFALGMTVPQIAAALGTSPKRVEKITTRIYKAVLAELTADESGETPLSRRQRSLLLVCLNGHASTAQRERARRYLADDPNCRAMLAQMRATIDRVAAVLPLPVLSETEQQHGAGVLDQLNQSSAALRDSITVAAPRVGGQSWLEPITGSVTTLGAAGAAKVIVICLSFGGGAAVCIEAGVFGRDDPAAAVTARERPRSKPAKDERPAKVRPRPVVKATPSPTRTVKRVSGPAPTPTPQPPKTNGPAAASPAPPGSTEFGVGSVGSQPAYHEPAPAPVDGGGEFTP